MVARDRCSHCAVCEFGVGDGAMGKGCIERMLGTLYAAVASVANALRAAAGLGGKRCDQMESMPEQRAVAMIEELAVDHAAYARVDFTNQVKMLHDTIEDMMMRLEEFESIFGMVQTEGAECLSGQIPRLQSARRELTSLCGRIDALEHVVARANVSLVALEGAADAAEADLGVPDTLFSKLNPLLLFKKAQEPATSTRIPTFDPPMIYKTEELFNAE